MLTICQPEVICLNNRSRLSAELDIDGNRKTLWFEVNKEYEKYLCCERSDAFLIGALPWAMRNKHDITCLAPVTEELLYNLNQHLIPILYKYGPTLHQSRIVAATTSEELEKYGGVGTGMSCGVDSFYSFLNHNQTYDERPNITHLCINNTGSFCRANYGRYGTDKAREEVYFRAKKVAKHFDISLIESNSNIFETFHFFVETHTYNTTFAILCMQKLWKTYFFSSAFDYSYFSLDNHVQKDCCYYDLLSLNCFSTRSLRIYSEGSALNRLEKTAFIAGFPIVQKYLHVCHPETPHG